MATFLLGEGERQNGNFNRKRFTKFVPELRITEATNLEQLVPL